MYKPGHAFYRTYLLPPVILLFAFVSIHLTAQLIINREGNLRLVKGKLVNRTLIAKRRPKNGYDFEIRLFLAGDAQYYRLNANSKKLRRRFEEVKYGDSLELKMPSEHYRYLTAHPNVIFDIKVNGKVLSSYQDSRDGLETSLLIVILFETFFIWLYIRHLKNRPTYI